MHPVTEAYVNLVDIGGPHGIKTNDTHSTIAPYFDKSCTITHTLINQTRFRNHPAVIRFVATTETQKLNLETQKCHLTSNLSQLTASQPLKKVLTWMHFEQILYESLALPAIQYLKSPNVQQVCLGCVVQYFLIDNDTKQA